MTAPAEGQNTGEAPGVANPPPPAAPREPIDDGDEERGIVGWARAIAFGIRDTAHDMLDEGRRGAAVAYDEGWQRFDKKTRGRRTQGAVKRRKR